MAAATAKGHGVVRVSISSDTTDEGATGSGLMAIVTTDPMARAARVTIGAISNSYRFAAIATVGVAAAIAISVLKGPARSANRRSRSTATVTASASAGRAVIASMNGATTEGAMATRSRHTVTS